MAEFSKWLQTIKIGWSNYLAYKTNFVLLVLGPTVVFFFIKYNLWSAIFDLDGVDEIQGYSVDQMLAYQVWVMIVALLAQSYNSMNLAEDIRLGRISSYLIYPFSFWKFHTANFLAIQTVHFFVAILTMFVVSLSGLITIENPTTIAKAFVLSTFVGFLWFQISYIIGLIAFWLEETWVLRVMFTTIAQFFSGALIPLELYPPWLKDILFWTPFPYLTFVPVRIFMGDTNYSFIEATLVIGFWFAVCVLIGRWVWSKGLKLYTAAGM